MAKYVVTTYDGTEMYTPSVYSDEKEAYSFYATTLLEHLCYAENIYKEEYQKYEDIFSEGNTKQIKSAVKRLMKKYVNDNTILETNNGYAFCNYKYHKNYVLEIFEVEEN